MAAGGDDVTEMANGCLLDEPPDAQPQVKSMAVTIAHMPATANGDVPVTSRDDFFIGLYGDSRALVPEIRGLRQPYPHRATSTVPAFFAAGLPPG